MTPSKRSARYAEDSVCVPVWPSLYATASKKQLLLLDEPNNHLDIEAVETLEAALNAYDGALIVVSHDVDFLERIGIERSYSL